MKWLSVRLESLISMYGGGTPSKQNPSFWNGDIPWVSPKDMGVRDIHDSQDHITQEAVEKSTTQVVPAGSILVVVRSGILVRKIPIAIAQRPLAINQDMKALVPNQDMLDARFLSYLLESKQQALLASYVKRGATVHSLQVDKLKRMIVQLPPMIEQRRIVKILDVADSLRQKRAEANIKAARIIPALFYKMFGDPGTNPKKWPTARLDEVVEIGTQLVDPNQPEYLDLPHVGGEEIEKETGHLLTPKLVRDRILRSGKFHFTAEHVLYSKIRPHLNKVAYPRFSGVCSADIYPLRPKIDSVSPWYIIGLLRSNAFLAYAKMHSERLRMPKLNREQLGAFSTPLPDPPTLKVFNRQANATHRMEAARFSQTRNISLLFESVLHQAFTGGLTAKWREGHMNEILSEMEEQTKLLNISEHRGN